MDEENQAVPETEYSIHETTKEETDEANKDTSADISSEDAVAANEKLPLRQYLRSGDFFEIVCCFIFGILCMLTQYPGTKLNIRPIPFQFLNNAGDYVLNLTNNQEYVGDTVTNSAVVVIGFVAPLVLQFILAKLPRVGSFGDAHNTVCVYFVATALVALATNTIKNYVGYLRPVFYDLCQPNDDYEECTNQDSLDARKSFPSGHSSLAFSGMTLLTMYLLRKFGVYSTTVTAVQQQDNAVMLQYTKPKRSQKAMSVLCLAPMAIACFVAASRLHDNMHFPADVVGGAVLGTALAWFTNGIWFLTWPTL